MRGEVTIPRLTLADLGVSADQRVRADTQQAPLDAADDEAKPLKAEAKGTLIIGLIQGLLGSLAFEVLGIQGAVFWGVVMIILSLLPVVGASLVWAPTAIYLTATGDPTKGIMLVVFGALVVGLADNVLRPILVGWDTKMPD